MLEHDIGPSLYHHAYEDKTSEHIFSWILHGRKLEDIGTMAP